MRIKERHSVAVGRGFTETHGWPRQQGKLAKVLKTKEKSSVESGRNKKPAGSQAAQNKNAPTRVGAQFLTGLLY